MTKRFVILTMLLLPFGAVAQLFSYGITAGAHVAQVEVDPFSIDPTMPMETVRFTATGGYHAGVFALLGAGLVYIEPQLWYTELNQSLTFTDGSGSPQTVPWTLRRLDVPLEVGVKMGPLLLFCAPVWSAPIAQISSVQTLSAASGSWGGQVGVGVKLGPIQLTARYEGSLAPFADQIQVAGGTYATDSRISQLITSLHLKL